MTAIEVSRASAASQSADLDRSPASFAHASEAELARIFDFYAVRWEYEPHVFPIQWNLDGHVVESFTPDFFLPDFDLYVELTTLRQPLVRKKNRKLRRLRELYPEIRIKLFYARDFRALMLKYGKGALVGALSGTPGQVLPVPPPPDPAVGTDDAVPGGNGPSAPVALPSGPSASGEAVPAVLVAGEPAGPGPSGRRRRRAAHRLSTRGEAEA